MKPGHLNLTTQGRNIRAAAADGRMARGERQGGSKLNRSQVLEIREAAGTHQTIAAEYGISRTHVTHIKGLQVWSWL